MLPERMPSADALATASAPSAAPSETAVSAVIFSGLAPVWHGGCAPTYSGTSFQPEPATAPTQDAVSWGCAQPRFLPPT